LYVPPLASHDSSNAVFAHAPSLHTTPAGQNACPQTHKLLANVPPLSSHFNLAAVSSSSPSMGHGSAEPQPPVKKMESIKNAAIPKALFIMISPLV
jgi:hypothetical protein